MDKALDTDTFLRDTLYSIALGADRSSLSRFEGDIILSGALSRLRALAEDGQVSEGSCECWSLLIEDSRARLRGPDDSPSALATDTAARFAAGGGPEKCLTAAIAFRRTTAGQARRERQKTDAVQRLVFRVLEDVGPAADTGEWFVEYKAYLGISEDDQRVGAGPWVAAAPLLEELGFVVTLGAPGHFHRVAWVLPGGSAP